MWGVAFAEHTHTHTFSSFYATRDPVVDEMLRWQRLDFRAHMDCVSPAGLLNKFKLMWKLRNEFPLHFVVFKQTASHLPHEGNVEQIFSTAGNLSDPNMDPFFLATLTRVARNKKAFCPSTESIFEKYFELFRNKKKKAEGATESG